MNGCLIKIILVILVIGVIFSVGVNNSDHMKEKFRKMKGASEIISKAIRYSQ